MEIIFKIFICIMLIALYNRQKSIYDKIDEKDLTKFK
jgi:hypothetical protein